MTKGTEHRSLRGTLMYFYPCIGCLDTMKTDITEIPVIRLIIGHIFSKWSYANLHQVRNGPPYMLTGSFYVIYFT